MTDHLDGKKNSLFFHGTLMLFQKRIRVCGDYLRIVIQHAVIIAQRSVAGNIPQSRAFYGFSGNRRSDRIRRIGHRVLADI